MSEHQPIQVKGYTPQSQERLDLVNANKLIEERTLRMIDQLQKTDFADQLWLAIARTQIEQGFMALNRAIFRPTRIDLDG